jgi:hypothetical protein
MTQPKLEKQAIRADAALRLEELLRVRDVLRVDADDCLVLSELTMIESQILATRKVLDDAA